jgi:hypothetical protein
MWQRSFALGQQRVGEVVEGASTACAPLAFEPWPVMVGTPGTDVGALATGTLERPIFPPQGPEVGVAGVGTEELVYMRQRRHG